jgi:large subunit ribosomal protein L3
MSEQTSTKSIGWILGKKLGMTQIFDETGAVHAVSVVGVCPAKVVQIKNTDKDGYKAIVIGCVETTEKHVAKPQKGHAKDLGLFSVFKEYRFNEDEENTFEIGNELGISQFVENQVIFVRGTSKGKGFQGVVKRHGFGGGRRTHGQKHSEREAGSIGGGGRAGGRVAKNMKMAGRMGGDTVSFKNLKVQKVDSETNQLFIEGAIPGHPGSLVEIQVIK